MVRYADDVLILCRSESGAQHALSVATGILEGDLKLTVNLSKTHVTTARKGNFLKMRMTSWRTSRSSYASMAIDNGYLAELGLFDLASIETGVLPDPMLVQ